MNDKIIEKAVEYLKNNFEYSAVIYTRSVQHVYIGNLDNFNEIETNIIKDTCNIRIIHDNKQYICSIDIQNLLDEIPNIKQYFNYIPQLNYQKISPTNSGQFLSNHINNLNLSSLDYKQVCTDICSLIKNYPNNLIKTIEDVRIQYIKSTKLFVDTNGLNYTQEISNSSLYGILVVQNDDTTLCSYSYGEEINYGFDTKLFVDKLVNKTLSHRNGGSIPSGRYNIILLKSSGALWSYLIDLLDGKVQVSGNSCVKLGQQIFNNTVNIWEDPLFKINEFLYDDEGIILEPKYFIKNGIVVNYICDTFRANILNNDSKNILAGNCFNFSIGTTNLFSNYNGEIIDYIFNTNVIVTDFMGDSFNSITGDISINILGYYYENNIKKVINNAIISGNILDFFKNTTILDDGDYNNLGSMFINNCYISSN